MHILYLTSDRIPAGDGSSARTLEIAGNLVRLGHQVDLVIDAGASQPIKEVISGVKVRRVKQTVLGRSIPILASRKLLSFLQRDYDVVLERFSTFGGTGTLVSLVKDIPCVLEVNAPHAEELIWRRRLRNPVKTALRSLGRLQFRLSAMILAPRPSIIPSLSQGKTRETAWGVNTDLFNTELATSKRVQNLRWTYDLEGRTVVVFCGSFESRQSVGRLAEIADRVTHEDANVRFLLVGEGPTSNELRKEIAFRRIADRVFFAGRQAYHEIPYFLACGHVGIAPYGVEDDELCRRFGFYGIPAKVFEYMAAGLPVVTFDYDALRRILGKDECGVLAAPGDIAGITEGVLGLCRDAARRSALGRNARKRAQELYAWPSQVQRLTQLLEGMLAKSPARRRLF
ncbi:MAG: glycosyltransferase family 4 protein [Planctomycetota bacterium]